MKCLKCNNQTIARQLCQTHYMQERRAGRLSPREQETPQQYILNRIKKSDSGCWEWQQSKFAGYGRLVKNKKSWPAHAYSYTAFVGPISEGLQINHKCHNRACCNPEHLYEGTQKENLHDMQMARRGNYLRGEINGNSKITEEIALKIYQASGIAKTIAAQYGVSISLVYAIKHKKIWEQIHEQ